MRTTTAAILTALLIALAAGCGGGSSSASSFCNKAKDEQKKYGSNFDLSNPANAKQAATSVQNLANSAPSAIKSDLQVFAQALNDIGSGNTAALQQDEAKFQTASTNIEKYLSDHCGIAPATTVPSAATPTT